MSSHSSQEITAVSDERQSSHRGLLRKIITKIAKGELKKLKVHGWLKRLPSNAASHVDTNPLLSANLGALAE